MGIRENWMIWFFEVNFITMKTMTIILNCRLQLDNDFVEIFMKKFDFGEKFVYCFFISDYEIFMDKCIIIGY